MHEKLREALRRAHFTGLASAQDWNDFERMVRSMFWTTLTILTNALLEMVGKEGMQEAATDWDKAFFIVGAVKKENRERNPSFRRARHAPTMLSLFDPPEDSLEDSLEESIKELPKPPKKSALRLRGFTNACPQRVKTKQLGQRLSRLSSLVLKGQKDTALKGAHASFTEDFGAFHAIYRSLKDQLLTHAPKKDSSLGKDPQEHWLGKLKKKGGGRKRYLGVTGQPDMGLVLIEEGEPVSWIQALVHLTVFRKRMQGKQLKQVMTHVDEDGADIAHSFTHVVLGGLPTCVWLHNTKSRKGEGATRIISFVDKQQVVEGTVLDTKYEDLDTLSILDLSYEELFLLLQMATQDCMGASDAKMAAQLLSFLGPEYATGDCKPISDGLFDTQIQCPLKVKTLGSERESPLTTKVSVSVRTVCSTVLSILFLSEPRHALPLWLSNLDALRCVATGAINFTQLFARKWTFVKGQGEDPVDVALVKDAPHTIGYLLASANIAKYTLSPDDEDTRKLKELIMPACEVFFKAGSLPDLSLMLKTLKTHFSSPVVEEDDDDFSGYFESKKDDEDEVDEVWGYQWDWTPPTSKGALKTYNTTVLPLRMLSLDNKQLVPVVRQLTFIAPIVKILLLRELLLFTK
ncbi:hypothetical protein [Corallococcus sp. CA053C]|uniref:hypothetical protein n=1 Tax=Corallococcus sp. CA053C TaxID=2316732 RepID=UPI0011C3C98C|nr:hypothetical protein [Corallococcus sp. CA053C]